MREKSAFEKDPSSLLRLTHWYFSDWRLQWTTQYTSASSGDFVHLFGPPSPPPPKFLQRMTFGWLLCSLLCSRDLHGQLASVIPDCLTINVFFFLRFPPGSADDVPPMPKGGPYLSQSPEVLSESSDGLTPLSGFSPQSPPTRTAVNPRFLPLKVLVPLVGTHCWRSGSLQI